MIKIKLKELHFHHFQYKIETGSDGVMDMKMVQWFKETM
jgi:hypothetical protein